jgi:cytochrome c biogenesis protein CcmG/thiol:disulfide interchange protein DsbE
MKRALMLLPLLIFLVGVIFLYRGLSLDGQAMPSALIGKPFPRFSLDDVQGDRRITERDLQGRASLVNVWGTWCVACRTEHPVLTELASQGVVIHGINYKDDNAAAVKWLNEFHNPYQIDISDPVGTLGLDLGVFGAPETFVVDAKGVIRYRHVGIIDERVWREELAPLYQQLVDEAAP